MCLTLPRSCLTSPSLSRYVSAISVLWGLRVPLHAHRARVYVSYQRACVCVPIGVSVSECEEGAMRPGARVMGSGSPPSSAGHRNAFSSSGGGNSRVGNPHCPAPPQGPQVRGLKSFLQWTLILILFCLPMCLFLARIFFLWASAFFFFFFWPSF